MEDHGRTIQAKLLVEAQLDMDIRGLQAGDGKRGSNASWSNGCCFDPAVVEQFVTMGAAQA